MPNELVTALIAGAVSVAVALITFFGRRGETSAANLATLIEGQGKRIESLETRLTKVEAELDASKAHNHVLRRALTEALAWVLDAWEWMQDPESAPPPRDPELEEWRKVLSE